MRLFAHRHGWTVVQHAGYVHGRDPQMIRGLQSLRLDSDRDAAVVERVGGRIFATRSAAESWAYLQAWPYDYTGLAPCAQGSFSEEQLHELPIYIPPDAR